MEEKRGSALFPGKRLLFRNVWGNPATTSHFDVPRQSVGGDLRLSGIARLGKSKPIELSLSLSLSKRTITIFFKCFIWDILLETMSHKIVVLKTAAESALVTVGMCFVEHPSLQPQTQLEWIFLTV